jgi:hypothetical protein
MRRKRLKRHAVKESWRGDRRHYSGSELRRQGPTGSQTLLQRSQNVISGSLDLQPHRGER